MFDALVVFTSLVILIVFHPFKSKGGELAEVLLTLRLFRIVKLLTSSVESEHLRHDKEIQDLRHEILKLKDENEELKKIRFIP